MTPQMLPMEWSFDAPVLLGIAVALLLYFGGMKYALGAGLIRRMPRWRALSFVGGLAMIFVALESPVDAWSERFLWAHMVQHELLIFAAAPLLIAGAPLWPFWRAVPLEARRSSLRWFMRHPRPRRFLLGVGKFIFAPRLVWILFVGDFIVWHFPALYDAALSNQTVHDGEHLLFLATALLFWAQVIPSHPLKPRLSYGQQMFYTFFAGVAMSSISLVYTLTDKPIYAYYAAVNHLPSGFSPLDDQYAASGLMDLTGMIIFGTLFMVLLWLWLAEDERESTLPTAGSTPLQPAQPYIL